MDSALLADTPGRGIRYGPRRRKCTDDGGLPDLGQTPITSFHVRLLVCMMPKDEVPFTCSSFRSWLWGDVKLLPIWPSAAVINEFEISRNSCDYHRLLVYTK